MAAADGMYESLESRIGQDWQFIESVAHRDGTPHDDTEVISCTDPETGAILAITLLPAEDGYDPWWRTVIVGDRGESKVYQQTGPTEGQCIPSGPNGVWEIGPAQLIAVLRGVAGLRHVAERRPELIHIGPLLPQAPGQQYGVRAA